MQPQPSTEKLLNENQELRDLCCFLDDGRQKSRRLAHEWQSFGRYTAAVLRNEVQGFETKLSILQEKLQKMSQENAELRDLCLFLNQMSGNVPSSDSQTPKLNSTQSGPYAGHAACVTDMNKTLGEMPQYTGFTGEAKLADNPQQIEQEKNEGGEQPQKKQSDPKSYVAQLEQRLERLEAEKLELVKSLSAAHILAATNTQENKDLPSTLPDETEVNSPPDIKAFIDFISEDKDKQSNEVNDDDATSQNRNLAQKLSPEDILRLSTLVEVSQRLDSAEANPKTDPMQATEAAALRVLIGISWEYMKTKYTPRGGSDSNQESHAIEIPVPGSPVKHSTTPVNTQAATLSNQNGGIILQTEL